MSVHLGLLVEKSKLRTSGVVHTADARFSAMCEELVITDDGKAWLILKLTDIATFFSNLILGDDNWRQAGA